jgi:excisionase family DNA binding protein
MATISTTDAAALLGVSARTVREWAHACVLPADAIRVGPTRVVYRFDPATLGRWLRDVRPNMRRVGRPRREAP